MKRIHTDKLVTHPLEEAFGIEPGTTVSEVIVAVPDEVSVMPDYDQKDIEIEAKLEEIYATAMGQVVIISDELDRVEGKFKARMGEVTATMLNVALSAVHEKTILKVHKDKLMSEKMGSVLLGRGP